MAEKWIIYVDSGENRMAFPTSPHVYGSLLVSIKSDAISNRIRYDGKVAPAFRLYLCLRGNESCAVVQSRFHVGVQVFCLEIHQYPSSGRSEAGE